MDLANRFVQVGDVRTHLWEGGVNASQTIVLVHDGGYGSDARSTWGHLIELLSEQFHVLAPDLTGYGNTDKVYRFDMDPFIQRVIHIQKLCEVLCVDKAFFVGASYGGAVVLRAALERLPQLVGGASISGTGGLFFVEERFTDLQNYSPSLEDARKVWDLLSVSATPEQIETRFRSSLIPGHWETLSAARLKNPAADPPPDRRPLLAEAFATIDVPMLFIAGSEDPLLEPGWEDRMASIVPGSVAHRIAGTRHEPHLDEPEQVARLLVDFIRAGESKERGMRADEQLTHRAHLSRSKKGA